MAQERVWITAMDAPAADHPIAPYRSDIRLIFHDIFTTFASESTTALYSFNCSHCGSICRSLTAAVDQCILQRAATSHPTIPIHIYSTTTCPRTDLPCAFIQRLLHR